MNETWDTLHRPGQPQLHWTTDNVGEAAPGVLTPLGWSIWGPVGDGHAREVAYRIGALTRAERSRATQGDGVVEIFYGRIAMKLEYLSAIGDRMPGTTGKDAVQGLVGRAPDDMTYAPTARRYPIIAWRLPWAMATSPRRVRAAADATDAWWRLQVPRLSTLDRPAATALFAEAVGRFESDLVVHSTCLLSVVQTLHEAVAKLVERAGVGDAAQLSGVGGAEMAIVADIWRASRGELSTQDVVRSHGFHGPLEGEVSSRVWREDPAPLLQAIAGYAAKAHDADPRLREQRARRELPARQAEVAAAFPAWQRPLVRGVLRFAARRLPLRGVGKRAFLQSLDVARGAARRVGECLVDERILESADDVFYLTADELAGPLPGDPRALVARRRARRTEYAGLRLPGTWTGTPTAIRIDDAAGDESGDTVTGVGVSHGVIEGIVRVVTDPALADVEDDEVLVAPTTDPSWASIMFLSCALVVDIGGPLSHAAVVARELGLPCVVNTRSGTRRLRTGDRVRVDGGAGTVEILERAGVAQPSAATKEHMR